MMITAENGFINQSERYSTDNAGQSLNKYILLKKGELAYNHDASKLRPYGSCFSLTTEENARIPFVYHCFSTASENAEFLSIVLNGKAVEKQLRKLVSSGARMDGLLNISFEQYTSVQILLPDVAEQNKIADYFRTLDNLIILYQRKCDELKEVKKYILQKMFPKNGETKPEIRFKGFTGDWEQKKLCEICNYISTNLTVKDIEKNGTVDLYDANGIIGKTTKNVQNRDYITIIKDGAGVGRVRLLSKNTSFISTMGAISTNNNSIEFLYYLISIIDFKKYIKTGTIPHIYFSEYGDEIIQLPSYEEQEKIGKFFYNLDNLITLYQRKCDELKKVKKYMLQNMFPRMS